MKKYRIELYNKRGTKLPESMVVEYQGAPAVGFKQHYLNHCRLFLNSQTDTIAVIPI